MYWPYSTTLSHSIGMTFEQGEIDSIGGWVALAENPEDFP